MKQAVSYREPVTKVIGAETKVDDAANGRIRAVLSTEAVDRAGDIIRQDGWVNLDEFMKHPVLLAGHNYRNILSQIGEWEDLEVRSKKLVGLARYYIGEGNEEADWAFKIAGKGRAAYSVGFIPLQWREIEGEDDFDGFPGYEFLEQELLECSHVNVPANPDALQLMVKMAKVHPEVLEIAKREWHEIEVGLVVPEPKVQIDLQGGAITHQANLTLLHEALSGMAQLHAATCDLGDDCPMRLATDTQQFITPGNALQLLQFQDAEPEPESTSGDEREVNLLDSIFAGVYDALGEESTT